MELTCGGSSRNVWRRVERKTEGRWEGLLPVITPACLPASLSHRTRRGCLAAWEPDFDQLLRVPPPHDSGSDNKSFRKHLADIGGVG